MEKIKQDKLNILKGNNLVTITKGGTSFEESNEDLWSFVDSLIEKGYEIISVNNQGFMIFLLLKK